MQNSIDAMLNRCHACSCTMYSLGNRTQWPGLQTTLTHLSYSDLNAILPTLLLGLGQTSFTEPPIQDPSPRTSPQPQGP